MMARGIAILVLLGSATAQSVAAEARANSPAADESPDDVEARVIYEEAIRALETGRTEQGLDALHRVASRFPQSSFADAARRKLAELGQAIGEPVLAARLRAPANPDSVETGRWELIIGQTALGGYYGLALSLALFDDPDEDLVLWSTVGGALGSLAASVSATQGSTLHDGYAHLHLDFQVFSIANTVLLLLAAEADDEQAVFGATAGAGLGGLALAMALGERIDIPRGQAETVTGAGWFGMWTGAAISVLVNDDPDSAAAVTVPMLIATDLGLVAGALAAPRLRWGKWRVRLVELGAVLGAGLGAAAIATIEPDSFRVGMGTIYGASLAGGIAAAIATRGFNTGSDRGSGPSASIVPIALPSSDGSAAPGLVLGGAF